MILQLLLLLFSCFEVNCYEKICKNGCTFSYESTFYAFKGWYNWALNPDTLKYDYYDLTSICEKISSCEECPDNLSAHTVLYKPKNACLKCPSNMLGLLCKEDCSTCPYSCDINSSHRKQCNCNEIPDEINGILECTHDTFLYINGELFDTLEERIFCNKVTGYWERLAYIAMMKRQTGGNVILPNQLPFTDKFAKNHLIHGNMDGMVDKLLTDPHAFSLDRGIEDVTYHTYILLSKDKYNKFINDIRKNIENNYIWHYITLRDYLTLDIVWNNSSKKYVMRNFMPRMTSIRLHNNDHNEVDLFLGSTPYSVKSDVTGCLPVQDGMSKYKAEPEEQIIPLYSC